MSYLKSQMLYDDGKHYKWTAKADHDNPFYTKGTDHSELNRTEGYEVLYFINHIGANYLKPGPPKLGDYQKMEKMIRLNVPSNIRTHKKVLDWISANWKSF